jgi:hypothetical protein
VQQTGPIHQGKLAGQYKISLAPAGIISCQPADEKEKQERVNWHKEQQRRAVDIVDKARKIQPDPKKGLLDSDNLFRNTVEPLKNGKLTLVILSPTHYSPDRHFDSRVKHPNIGGEYPVDPKALAPGVVPDPGESFGELRPGPPPPTPIQTFTPKSRICTRRNSH